MDSEPDRESDTDEPGPRVRKRWLAAFAAIMIARGVGLALFPVLLLDAPAALLLLSPILGHLVLTSSVLAPWVYFCVGLGASIVQSVIAYEFGLLLGAHALLWLEGRGGATHAVTTRILVWMQRAAPVVLIAMAGPSVCALAGVSRLRARVFYPAMLSAQVLWVGGCFLFGAALTHQLDLVLAFIGAHVLELTATALTWVVGGQLLRRYRRRRAAAQRI